MPSFKKKTDGQNFTFTPGANGSLVSDPQKQTNFTIKRAPTAKTIGPGKMAESAKKNRGALIKALVGASRG